MLASRRLLLFGALVAPIGYAFVVDSNGAYVVDINGFYLIAKVS